MLRLTPLLWLPRPTLGQDNPQAPDQLVTVRRGTLPIILPAEKRKAQ